MVPNIALTGPQQFKLFTPDPTNWLGNEKSEPKTPNEWFGQRYPDQIDRFGSPFIELVQPLDQFTNQVHAISINTDFFAGVLGGRRDLGHHVVYFEGEMAWYFRDSDGIFKATTAEKLANLYRALMVKCAEAMPPNVQKLNLFHEFRSDKVAKAVVNRAKSVLAADSSFFSPTSPHQRIRGVELAERIARRFVEELLTAEPGQVLMLADAYQAFCSLLKQRDLGPLKRSDFKAIVTPLIQDEFHVRLRNDLVVDERQGVRGWKNLRLSQALPG